MDIGGFRYIITLALSDFLSVLGHDIYDKLHAHKLKLHHNCLNNGPKLSSAMGFKLHVLPGCNG